VQPIFDTVGLTSQPVGAPVADPIPAIEAIDLPLDAVDPRLQGANLAPIVVKAVAITTAITLAAITIGLRLRIILCSGGAGGDESRACGGKGKDDLTHNGSPSLRSGLMRVLCADSVDAGLNASVMSRSTLLMIEGA
jgi:hypothetical protein